MSTRYVALRSLSGDWAEVRPLEPLQDWVAVAALVAKSMIEQGWFSEFEASLHDTLDEAVARAFPRENSFQENGR